MKKICAILLSICLLILCFAFPVCADGHTLDERFGEAESLVQLGLLRGTGNSLELSRAVTREEGAAMIVRLLGQETAAADAKYLSPYQDVEEGRWSKNAVVYCTENGLLQGRTFDFFEPESNLAAEEFLAALLRALGYSEAGARDIWQNAASLGLLEQYYAEELAASVEFPRSEMAYLSYQALRTEDSGGTIMARRLREKGILTDQDMAWFDNSCPLSAPLDFKGAGEMGQKKEEVLARLNIDAGELSTEYGYLGDLPGRYYLPEKAQIDGREFVQYLEFNESSGGTFEQFGDYLYSVGYLCVLPAPNGCQEEDVAFVQELADEFTYRFGAPTNYPGMEGNLSDLEFEKLPASEELRNNPNGNFVRYSGTWSPSAEYPFLEMGIAFDYINGEFIMIDISFAMATLTFGQFREEEINKFLQQIQSGKELEIPTLEIRQ